MMAYKTDNGPRQREFLPPRAYAVLREQKDLLEKTLDDSSSLSQQHLVSVLRKMQAGTSALMVTEEAMMTDAMQQSSLDNDYHYNDGTANDDPPPVFMEPPSSLSSEALHILQALETSGFEGTPTEESDAINSLIDQLPLSNFMTEVESVDDFLHTRVEPLDHEVKPITMKVGGTFEQMIKSHWDSCASACFESSLDHCVPNSFVKLEKKIVTADGGCNSDGIAWRCYHIPINDEWIALGDEYGIDLRQADVITFAMPPIVATKFQTPVSIVAAPVAKGLLISTNIAAGYHEQDSIMLHRRPDLAYPLHHKANGLPYAAFVDDKLVRERGLRMVSLSDLLPYSDEKAMKMLSTQWKYHDPSGTYWTTVEKCYTSMAVGHVHRNVSHVDPPPLHPSAARTQDCPTDSERGGLRFDARQHNADCRLGNQQHKSLRVACVVSSSHKNAQDSSRVDQAAPSANLSTHVVGVDRAAPAIYDDLHNCVGWPPSDSSSSTVFDSHSYLSEARVLTCKPSLKTVDSLFFTGEKEHDRKSVSFAEQRSQTQRKHTEACTGSFDGPVIDIALVACGLSSTLSFSQNAASRSSCDLKSSLYQPLPLNVKYIVDVKSDLLSLACANGTNVAKYGDLVALIWDLKTNKRSVTSFQVQGMELTIPCLRNIAHEMFLVRHSSMGECARASSGDFKIIDQLCVHECSSSEPGSGVVSAIDDGDSVDASMEFLNGAIDKLDDFVDSPTDDQKLTFLKIVNNIKGGHLKMMTVEFDAIENDFCTEHISGDDHNSPDLCLAKENTYKRKCSIFDTGASQNAEQDRSAFIVYFEAQSANSDETG